MIARLLDAETSFFAEMDPAGRTVDVLPIGTELALEKVQNSRGMDWVPAKLANGTTGYIKGDARVFMIKEVALLDPAVDVRAQPSDVAPPVRRIGKGHRFQLLEVVQSEGRDWVRIRDQVGTGFVLASVKIRELAKLAEIGPRPDVTNDLLSGVLWCIGGVVVTAATYAAASGGGVYIVAWGAMLVGLVRIVRGSINALRK
jgi:hypothetical protein